MKCHITNATSFLRAMAECLEHDRVSISGWSCLTLPGLLADDSHNQQLALIKNRLDALEGAIIAGAAGDLLIIYRSVSQAGALRLQQLIQETLSLPDIPFGQTSDLFIDWRAVCHNFRQQIAALEKKPTLVDSGNSPEYDEVVIKQMSSVLQGTKFSRRYRSPMRVMLVEDDPVTRQMVGKMLGQENVVIMAENAYEAVVNYLLHAPELVFLDINLPDQSGFNVLDQITACDPDAYVVMFSGNDGIDNIIDSRNRGAQGFVAKPFQRDRIRHYLAERQIIESDKSRH